MNKTARPYLRVAQAAERLAWSEDSVLRAVKRGDLPAVRYGRLVSICPDGLDAFIAARSTSKPARLSSARRTA